MSAGAGGGASKSSSKTGYNLNPYVKKYEAAFAPLRGEFLGQTQELLQTGGIGAQLPLIASMLASQGFQNSQALQGATRQFAGAGLGGTPYEAAQLANMRQQQGVGLAGIPAQLYGQQIGAIPGLVQGQMGQILSALASQSKSKSSSWNANAQGGKQ